MNDWQKVNNKLIAKAIAELSYEQVLTPEEVAEGRYELRLDGGVCYEFRAWRTIWDFLRVDTASLRRIPESKPLRADQFYIDTQSKHGMSAIVLSNFIEELYRTLHSDIETLRRQREKSGDELLSLTDTELQSYLDGHPKALANKGRIGWSAADLKAYSPESSTGFQLHWLAIRKTLLIEEFAEGFDAESRLRQSMGPDEVERLLKQLQVEDLDLSTYSLLPVHPWQWEEIIPFHFQDELHSRDLVPLGIFGDTYRPQTSLRTLSNAIDPRRLQIKLPLSILNTSCIRGIDGRYIPIAPRLTQTIRNLCAQDELLSGVRVLGDASGSFVPQRTYQEIEDAPYRYREFLGAIWRESPESLEEEGETTLLTASLFHKSHDSKSFLAGLIARSGLTTEDWLSSYFKVVVVPLYHLQLKYGVGLVSHGQNIMLGLKDSRPNKLIIKDFQGDLRLLDQDIPELDIFSADLKATLTRMPAPYLIHDLLTGHFITVLRFVSAVLAESNGFPESRFYQLLAREIRQYHRSVPAYAQRIEALGLLAPEIPRVLVNKVRFQIGYGDNALRPLPILGTPLKNPLYEDPHDSRA